MSDKNTGGRAFPAPTTKPLENYYPGMTLRDYFAAKVLQTYLADPTFSNVTQGEICRLAYDMADAMLKAREA